MVRHFFQRLAASRQFQSRRRSLFQSRRRAAAAAPAPAPAPLVPAPAPLVPAPAPAPLVPAPALAPAPAPLPSGMLDELRHRILLRDMAREGNRRNSHAVFESYRLIKGEKKRRRKAKKRAAKIVGKGASKTELKKAKRDAAKPFNKKLKDLYKGFNQARVLANVSREETWFHVNAVLALQVEINKAELVEVASEDHFRLLHEEGYNGEIVIAPWIVGRMLRNLKAVGARLGLVNSAGRFSGNLN